MGSTGPQQQPPQQQNMSGGGKGYQAQQGYGPQQGYGGYGGGYGQQSPFFNNGQGVPFSSPQNAMQAYQQQVAPGTNGAGIPPSPFNQTPPSDPYSQFQSQQNMAQGSSSQPMQGETYPQYQARMGGQQPLGTAFNQFQQQQQFGNAGGKGPSAGGQMGQGAAFAHGGKVKISKKDLERIVHSVNTAKKVAGE